MAIKKGLKSKITIFTAWLFVFGLCFGEIVTVKADRYYYRGDINCDEAINAIDLVRFKQYFLGITIISVDTADVNNDGSIDIRDMIRLKKYIVGYYDITYTNSVSQGVQWTILKEANGFPLITIVGYTVTSKCRITTSNYNNGQREIYDVECFAFTEKSASTEFDSPEITVGTTRLGNTEIALETFTNSMVSPNWIYDCKIGYPNMSVSANATFSNMTLCMMKDDSASLRIVKNDFTY